MSLRLKGNVVSGLDIKSSARLLYDDFWNPTGEAVAVVAGTGAAVTRDGNVALAGMQSPASLETGTTTTGIAFVGRNWLQIAAKGLYMSTYIYLPALSTGSEEFVIGFGIMGDSLNAAPTHSAMLIYDRTVDLEWNTRTSNGGTATTKASTVTVAATTFYHLEMLANSDFTSVSFFINGSLATAAHTTNLPDFGTDKMYAGLYIAKYGAGTTTSLVYSDYILAEGRNLGRG